MAIDGASISRQWREGDEAQASARANARDKQVNVIRIAYKTCRGSFCFLSFLNINFILISCVSRMELAEWNQTEWIFD